MPATKSNMNNIKKVEKTSKKYQREQHMKENNDDEISQHKQKEYSKSSSRSI